MTGKSNNEDELIDLSHPPEPRKDEPKPDLEPDEKERFHALEFQDRGEKREGRGTDETDRSELGRDLWLRQSKRRSEEGAGHVGPESFRPPVPKERIFHAGGSLPVQGEEDDVSGLGSFSETQDPEPPVSLTRSKLDVDTEDWDSFSDHRNIFRENAWARNPGNIALAILVSVGLIYYFPGRFTFILVAIIFTIFSSYWLYPRNRYGYRYNMDWDANADPVGCGSRYGYYSRWWWW
jgi:hypothetical protein